MVARHLHLSTLSSTSGLDSPALVHKLKGADACVASLAALAQSGSLPLALALDTFELTIEGAMRFGKWLPALATDAEPMLRLCAFLGAPPWRSAAAAMCELGCRLDKF